MSLINLGKIIGSRTAFPKFIPKAPAKNIMNNVRFPSMFPKGMTLKPSRAMPQKRFLLQSIGLNMLRFKDSDKDKRINAFDCFPFDKKKHIWREKRKYYEEKYGFQFPEGKAAKPFLKVMRRSPEATQEYANLIAKNKLVHEPSDIRLYTKETLGETSSPIRSQELTWEAGHHRPKSAEHEIPEIKLFNKEKTLKDLQQRESQLINFAGVAPGTIEDSKSRLKRAQVPKTFFHEIKHVIQERDVPDFNKKYWANQDYYEDEAKDFARMIKLERNEERRIAREIASNATSRDQIGQDRELRPYEQKIAQAFGGEYTPEIDRGESYAKGEYLSRKSEREKYIQKPGKGMFDADDDKIIDAME